MMAPVTGPVHALRDLYCLVGSASAYLIGKGGRLSRVFD
jgi:hypothetical protein